MLFAHCALCREVHTQYLHVWLGRDGRTGVVVVVVIVVDESSVGHAPTRADLFNRHIIKSK